MNTVFHLALPVRDLSEARQFYVDYLKCKVGRVHNSWLDMYFFGHQLTLHEKPEEVLAEDAQGIRHFGAILDWESWENLCDDLIAKGVALVFGPEIKYRGEPREQGKIFFRDPSGNGIELKTYRRPQTALSLPQEVGSRFLS